ncbi:hypothetical protein EG329_010438 [Mollisiaceae sp. DMI_Dod_QoI]|nr:hypothetical protein EG329_010438 [Helotiales sp. DMI_Dod_QoI]
MSTECSRFKLPGLNLPINWTPDTERNIREAPKLFPCALSDVDVSDGAISLPLTTLREFTMLQVMNHLTDKPDWHKKVFDENIAQKWKDEAMATKGRDVSQKMVDWIIDELRWKAEAFRETGAISIYNGDVVKSDVAIPESIKVQLQAEVQKLEIVPERYKDWHPGSEKQVLDLVHPSLFPLIYGQSRVVENELIKLEDCIESCGKGKVITGAIEEVLETDLQRRARSGWRGWPDSPYSKKFQWLPCEVDISDEHGPARITSYINNLHPHKYRELYELIEDIITKAIPLWNITLTPLRESSYFRRITYSNAVFDPDPEDIPDEQKPQPEDEETEEDYWDRVYKWEENIRKTVQPEPGDFRPLEGHSQQKGIDIKKEYGHRGIQVIVKLANIVLTPENSQYKGGSWHVEGQLNEHICATALYYYDSENITDSHLAFRQQSSADDASNIGYPQNVHGWLEEVFGCYQDGPAVQNVGSVLCREGRLLTFPNILQHQVQSFELADPTKPGYRKILALFLVDPGIRVISTVNVPPQRKDWWSERVDGQMTRSGKALGKMSNELKDKIFEDVDDFPISMEQAKDLRLELMAERSVFVSEHEEIFGTSDKFSLCEH